MKNSIRRRLIAALVLLMVPLAGPAWALTQNEIQKLLASDGAAGDTFGRSVEVDGDTAVIGAPNDDDNGSNSGSAYVFTRSAGVWTEQQKVTPSDGAAGDSFGWDVALDGDTVVIGARARLSSNTSGSAYVFIRSAGVWIEQQKLTPSDGAAGDLFGYAVAVNGGTTVIGARWDDDNGSNSGSAYVFTRSAGIWTEQQKLTPGDAAASQNFGFSVALDGDTTIIFGGNNDPGTGTGAAYVFTRSAGVWSEQQKLTASDAAPRSTFGQEISIDGDTAVIGARFTDDPVMNGGAAYVFVRSAGIWTEQQKLTSSDVAENDRFGFSVPVLGNTAVISSFRDEDNGDRSGSAYVFTRSTGVWTEQQKLLPSDGAAMDNFSLPIDIDGDTIMLGALNDDDQGTDSGSVYVFSLVTDEESPVVTNVVATPNPVAINTVVTLTANVDDTTTGGSDIASADYTLDGGAGVGMDAQDGDFDEMTEDVTAVVPAFTEAGVHNLCVLGTDAAGNVGEEDCTFLAVYDPDGGFVTGGGWIDSPAGAYAADPVLKGKANFGFISKYKKGATIPTGNTEFQFNAGGLNFHSSSYQWLVVANHRAQYKGVGTINSGGNYGFMLTAIDAKLTPSTNVDLFRIKIWDKDSGDGVVYDNQPGGTDDANPTTAIGGGSIVINAPGKK